MKRVGAALEEILDFQEGEEGAGGLHCAECNKPMEHAPGIGAYCREHGDGPAREDVSALSSPQRAFVQIREAVEAMRAGRKVIDDVLTFDLRNTHSPSDQDMEAASLKLVQAITSLLALLGEAPPKAEQDNVTYELPPGATVQPQARNQEEK